MLFVVKLGIIGKRLRRRVFLLVTRVSICWSLHLIISETSIIGEALHAPAGAPGDSGGGAS